MNLQSESSYCVTAECDAPADVVFDFLSDGLVLGGWALGCFNTEPAGDGVFGGRALDTGQQVYARPVPDRERGIVVFHVGVDPSELTPWIWAIVHPSDRFGGDDAASVVSMIAWRPVGMSDEDWNIVCREHDIEILIIKGQVERRTGT